MKRSVSLVEWWALAALSVALAACGDSAVTAARMNRDASHGGGLSIGPDTTLEIGDTVRFEVINPAGHDIPSPAIRWSSSDTLTVSVSPDGTVRGLVFGSAVISAELGNRSLMRTVTVTPPEGRIYFMSQTPRGGLYSVRADGSARGTITNLPWAAYSDASPDGRWVVYTGAQFVGGVWRAEVVIQSTDGTRSRIIYDAPGSPAGVSWSPLGDLIAFAAQTCSGGPCGPTRLLVVDTAGAGLHQVTSINGAQFPSWSPDGTRIAFNTHNGTDRDISIVNADGSNLGRITGDSIGDGYSENHPAWLSNTRLVFGRGPRAAGSARDIYAMDVDDQHHGSNLVRLASDSVLAFWPRPSPDRRWVVYWAGTTAPSLGVVRVDGQVNFKVPTATSGQLFPSWGPEPGN